MTGRPHVTHDELRRRLRAGDPLAGETPAPETMAEARRRTLEAAAEAGHDPRLRGSETVPKRVWSGAAVAAAAVSVVVLAAVFSPWVGTPRDEERAASGEEAGGPDSASARANAAPSAANAAAAPEVASPTRPAASQGTLPTAQAETERASTPAATGPQPELRRSPRTRRASTLSPTIGAGTAPPTAGPAAAVAVPAPPAEGESPASMSRAGETRQILFTTSGGTRIYWFLTTDTSTTPRRHPEERTWSLN